MRRQDAVRRYLESLAGPRKGSVLVLLTPSQGLCMYTCRQDVAGRFMLSIFRPLQRMAGTRFAYVKNFELPDTLLPGTYILLRLDGHGFHR